MENKTIDPWIPPKKPISQTPNNSLPNQILINENEFEPIFNGLFFVRFVYPEYKGIYNSKKELLFQENFQEYFELKQINCKKKVYQLYINGEIYDLEKKKKISPNFSISKELCYYEDRLAVKNDELWGFVNTDFKVCIPMVYEKVTDFIFFKLSRAIKNKKHGLIDINGIEKIELKYDFLYTDEKFELIVFELDGKDGILDYLNNVIVPNVFLSIIKNPVCNGFLGYRERVWEKINYRGEIITTKFEEIKIFSSDSILFTKIGNKWGIIGFENREIFANIFDSLEKIKDIIILKFDGLYRISDLNGKIFENTICKKIRYFEDEKRTNLVFLLKENKWDLFNISEKKYIEYKYDDFDEKNEFYLKYGFLKVEKYLKFGFINTEGKEVVPPIYEEILPFREDVPLEFQLIGVKLNGKWGYINIKGEIIISLMYEEVTPFEKYSIYENKYLAKVKEKSNSKIIYLFSDGIEFDEIKFINKKVDASTKSTYKRITTIWFIYLIILFFLILFNINLSDFLGNLIVGGFFILSFLEFVIVMVYISNFIRKIFK